VDDAFKDPTLQILHPKTTSDVPKHTFPLLGVIHLYKLMEDAGDSADAGTMRRYLNERLHQQLSSSTIWGSPIALSISGQRPGRPV
jgi:hypothetical protein